MPRIQLVEEQAGEGEEGDSPAREGLALSREKEKHNGIRETQKKLGSAILLITCLVKKILLFISI